MCTPDLIFVIAGRNQSIQTRQGDWEYVYGTLVIVWTIFGLGYIIMIFNIIADGLKENTKKVVRKLSNVQDTYDISVISNEELNTPKSGIRKVSFTMLPENNINQTSVSCHSNAAYTHSE